MASSPPTDAPRPAQGQSDGEALPASADLALSADERASTDPAPLFDDHAPGIDGEDKILYGVVGVIMLLLFGFFSLLTFRVIPPEKAVDAATLQERVLVDGDTGLSFLASQLHLTELRYRHAAQSVFANTARSNAAFLVGSLMALLGGLIIVRRVRDTNTNLQVGAQRIFDVQIASSSPGIILASLGMIVIVASLLTDTHIQVDDAGIQSPQTTVRAASSRLAPVSSDRPIDTSGLLDSLQTLQNGAPGSDE